MITNLGPPPLVSSLLLLDFFPKFKNSPPKIAPFFFVICWFHDVLLFLIHGFVVSQVGLAFPFFSPISIHEIISILPQEIVFFRPRSQIWNLGFVPEEIPRPPELPDSTKTSGRNKEFTQNPLASPRLFSRPPELPA